jgi:hypothetical protein
MLQTDHVIDLVWPVGMLLVQKATFTAALGTNGYALAKIIRNFRTQAEASGGPGLWLGSADARAGDSRQAPLAHRAK